MNEKKKRRLLCYIVFANESTIDMDWDEYV